MRRNLPKAVNLYLPTTRRSESATCFFPVLTGDPSGDTAVFFLRTILVIPKKASAGPPKRALSRSEVSALWIKAVSRGPALYHQVRAGETGRPIRVWKLRTMRSDAESVLDGHLLRFPEAPEEWQRYFKLKKDPRILPGIGHLLRRTSLDELPQLWNVLVGEMSLVGPRPIVAAEREKYGTQFRLYCAVRPGMTGLWQISGRNDTTYANRVSLDQYYVHNWSVWLDLHILSQTASAVIRADGAY